MIPTDIVFDTYLDANILMALGFALWLLACAGMRMLKVSLARRTQLWLLNGMFLAVLLSPLMVSAALYARDAGLLPNWLSPNLTDHLLALFLNGQIDMAATEFERVIALRETFTQDVSRFDGLLGQTIAALLAAGLVLFTLQTGRSIVCLRRTIRSSYAWRRTARVELRLSDTVTVPFSTRGLIRRYVVVPSGLLQRPDDLRIVLQHEFQHLRHSDIEWEIALECLRAFFFWNPVFTLWKLRVEELREYAVDQQVLRRHKLTVAAYGGCLLRVCEDIAARRSRALAGPAVGFLNLKGCFYRRRTADALNRRITSLMEPERRARPCTGFIVLSGLVATLWLSALAIQNPPVWSQDRLMLATIVNLERLEAINASGLGVRPQ